MKIHCGLTAIAFTLQIASLVAAPIANWKEFNPAKVVPVDDADTDAPTFGDGVTVNSAQSSWIAGMFGTVGSPASVTLAVGETLTVSGTVILTGGSNNSTQNRFGIFHDAGQFALDDGNNWTGGWLHTIGNTPSADLWGGRTDGPWISTAGNAVDLAADITRTGTFDGSSATEFTFAMSVTRDSETTVDVISRFIGGDENLDELYVKDDIATAIFTYNAFGWLAGGSSAVEQVAFSDVAFAVTGGGEARILAIRVVGTDVEIDYETPEGKTYFLDSSLDMNDWGAEVEDSVAGTGTVTDQLAIRFPAGRPIRVFYRLREKLPN
ncbi:MAG: hypothetical protein ACI9UA_001254 [Pseudoalteromonas tetraodonis]|jgi:hypothetical protein